MWQLLQLRCYFRLPQDFRDLRQKLALQVHLDERRSLLAAFHLLDWDGTGTLPFDRFVSLVTEYVPSSRGGAAPPPPPPSSRPCRSGLPCGSTTRGVWPRCSITQRVRTASSHPFSFPFRLRSIPKHDTTLPRLMIREMHEMSLHQGGVGGSSGTVAAADAVQASWHDDAIHRTESAPARRDPNVERGSRKFSSTPAGVASRARRVSVRAETKTLGHDDESHHVGQGYLVCCTCVDEK